MYVIVVQYNVEYNFIGALTICPLRLFSEFKKYTNYWRFPSAECTKYKYCPQHIIIYSITIPILE